MLSIIVPVYNEVESLRELRRQIGVVSEQEQIDV